MASLKRLAAGLVLLLLTVVTACGGNSSPNNLPGGVKEGFGDFPKNALAPTTPSPGCSVQNQAYEGYTPAPAGCACKATWSYSGHTYCNGECDNPDNDPNGPWCFTQETCAQASWAYCSAPHSTTPTCTPSDSSLTPPSGCTCRESWTYKGQTFCSGQCGNPDNDSNGSWCYTTSPCNGNNWAYCSAPEK